MIHNLFIHIRQDFTVFVVTAIDSGWGRTSTSFFEQFVSGIQSFDPLRFRHTTVATKRCKD